MCPAKPSGTPVTCEVRRAGLMLWTAQGEGKQDVKVLTGDSLVPWTLWQHQEGS